jgi:hypothetical protein
MELTTFAHMVGEHHHQSTSDKLSHTLISWAGFVAAAILGGILCYIVYKRTHKTAAKVVIKKETNQE